MVFCFHIELVEMLNKLSDKIAEVADKWIYEYSNKF